MLRQLNALWVLGLALLRKILLMPFVRRRGGGPWLARLRAERLTPTPVAAWSRFERASRCIGRGRRRAAAGRGRRHRPGLPNARWRR